MSSSGSSSSGVPRAASCLPLQFSVRDLLFATIAISCVLSALFTWGAAIALGVMVVFGLLLGACGYRAKNRMYGCLGLILAVLGLPALGIVLAASLFFHMGPIYFERGWPPGLKEMIAAADVGGADVKIAGRGGFIDYEDVWRLAVPRSKLGAITSTHALAAVPETAVPVKFWRVFPWRWRPAKRSGNQFFATPGFPVSSRVEDGDHYFVMYDPQSERLYVWHKFHF